MRRFISLLIASALVLAVAAPALAVDSFVGHWTSTDTDGSNQTLDVWRTNGFYQLVVYDDGASTCGVFDENGDPTVAAIGKGTGTADGDDLTASFMLKCQMPASPPFMATVTFTYDSGTDTLTDNFGVVWYRS